MKTQKILTQNFKGKGCQEWCFGVQDLGVQEHLDEVRYCTPKDRKSKTSQVPMGLLQPSIHGTSVCSTSACKSTHLVS